MYAAAAIPGVELVAESKDAESSDVVMVVEHSEDTNVCAKVACELES